MPRDCPGKQWRVSFGNRCAFHLPISNCYMCRGFFITILQPMLNLERHSNVLQNCNLFSIFYINEQNCKDRHLILENCREIRNLDKSGILF